jgi:hypothetical protein
MNEENKLQHLKRNVSTAQKALEPMLQFKDLQKILR